MSIWAGLAIAFATLVGMEVVAHHHHARGHQDRIQRVPQIVT